jgi:hypothetical protein
VLVLLLQQLDVLHEQQLEHEQLELVQSKTRASTASTSSISNVSVSSARSSSASSGILSLLSTARGPTCWPRRR